MLIEYMLSSGEKNSDSLYLPNRIYANNLLQSLLLYKNRYTTHLSSGEKNWGENKTSQMKDKEKRIHWVTNWVRNIVQSLATSADARVAADYILIVHE